MYIGFWEKPGVPLRDSNPISAFLVVREEVKNTVFYWDF